MPRWGRPCLDAAPLLGGPCHAKTPPPPAAQNARPAYMDRFLDSLVSWDAVAKRYQAAL